jgi:hypothetical protein
MQRNFGAGCVMTADTKNQSLVSVDIGTKNSHFLYHIKDIGCGGRQQRPGTSQQYKLFL